MRRRFAQVAIFLTFFSFAAPYAWARAEDPSAPVREAVAQLEKYLDSQPTGKGWRDYLNLAALKAELDKGAEADPKKAAEFLKLLEGEAPGLELEPFARLRDALRQWPESVVVAKAANLQEAIASSEAVFYPPGAADVATARSELTAAMAGLDRYLNANPAVAAGWREFLRWKELQAQVAAPKPDVDALETIDGLFSTDATGLEMPVFMHVRKALENFANLLTAAREDLQPKYIAHLKSLADKIKEYESNKSSELASAVGSDLAWLEAMHLDRPLVEDIRKRFSTPNLHVRVSSKLIAAGTKQSLDETGPITDSILGTAISGTAHTVANIDGRPIDDQQRAVVDLTLKGTTHTNTVGYNGPATIYSKGTTQIEGNKKIAIDASGFSSYPATAKATTQTQVMGVGARGGIAQRVATDRVYESKPEAEQIAGMHAAARVRHRMEAQADKQLGKAQANYLKNIRNPLLRHDDFPSMVEARSTDQALSFTALQANPAQLGAPLAAPTLADEHDLALQLHESMINNLAAAMLAGVTLKEKEVQDKVIEWRGKLPEQLQSEPDKEPWSITFAKSRPVTVKFTDDGVQITIRGNRYTSGDREFRAMDVTARYKIKPHGSSYRLMRDEELEIAPPNFVPGKTRLSGSQVTLKALLQRKFGKLFDPEIKAETMTFSGQLEKVVRSI